MSPKYPLEAALTVRRLRTDARAEALAEHVAATEARRDEVARVERALEATIAQRSAVEQAERARLEDGAVLAAELALVDGYRLGRELERERQERELARARQELAAARDAERRARSAFEGAFAEQRAVERHKEAHLAAERAQREQRDEDEALDLWNAEQLSSRRR